MTSPVPTVAQVFCFKAKDSSAVNMRQNTGGIVLVQKRLGTKEQALRPPTTKLLREDPLP